MDIDEGHVPYEWLWDTPLFISGERIESLYHAVALPETEEEYRTITDKVTKGHKVGASVGGEASGEHGGGLLSFLPSGLSISLPRAA